MLTIFSTPKPFRGHIEVIQRNAIRSWMRLHPEIEIILFGDEEGAAEIAREHKIRNEPEVRRSETGTKYLNFLFERAQQLASHRILCYVNCDIMLMSSFQRAVEQSAAIGRPFLMVGRRWDTDIMAPWDFSRPDWERQLETVAFRRGERRSAWPTDYFVFSHGLYQQLPPLVVGRNYWDNWLIWRARTLGAAVVDASPSVIAVHQNHNYAYHAAGIGGVESDEQARRNKEIAGNGRHMYPMYFATHRATRSGVRRHWLLPLARARMVLTPIWYRCWFAFLKLTRPLRHLLGLNNQAFDRLSRAVKALLRSQRERRAPAI